MIKGYRWESDIFGLSSNDARQLTTYENRVLATKKICRVQSLYNWNPLAPHTLIARELFECTKSYLCPSDAAKLGMYCALGSSLDIFHATDGFFKIDSRIMPFDLKSGRGRAEDIAKNKSMLLLRSDCEGPALWRVCFRIARAIEPANGAEWLYTI